MPYYKLVYRTSETYRSFVIHSRNTDMLAVYELDKYTFADKDLLAAGYGLLVFDSKESLRNWGCDFIRDFVFEVEIGEILPVPQLYAFGNLTKSSLLLNRSNLAKIKTPKGTVCTDKVKLLKRIYE